ncbi:hypothetical protein [Mesorhizobium sp. WSM3868]|uniref:hypothetical protein n=1 Tax=Mesorhizobium sp. WSM3868 TaxID=2029405 RepID=UPI001FE1E13C|nr:hypothetical protein [Mesorhizobium sp. WSM3868]
MSRTVADFSALGLVARRSSTEASSAKPPMPPVRRGLRRGGGAEQSGRNPVSSAYRYPFDRADEAAHGAYRDVPSGRHFQTRSRGLRPLMLAFSAFIFIATFSMTLVKLV